MISTILRLRLARLLAQLGLRAQLRVNSLLPMTIMTWKTSIIFSKDKREEEVALVMVHEVVDLVLLAAGIEAGLLEVDQVRQEAP